MLAAVVDFFKSNFWGLKNTHFLLFNILIGSLISLLYFASTPYTGIFSLTYITVSLVVQIGVIYSLIYLAFGFLPKPLQNLVMPLVYSVLGLFLFADTQIYYFLKFHFNSLVWNVLITPGGWESLGIKTWDIYIIIFIALSFTVAQYLLYIFCQRKLSIPLLRTKLLCSGLLGLYLVGSSLYAYGDLYDIYEITKVYNVVPGYQPLTVKRTFKKVFGYLPTPDMEVVEQVKSELHYPLKDLKFKKTDTQYNFIFLVIDSFRAQSFTPEITPHLFDFAKKSQNFTLHYSGGNGTRNGVFSLFYGIYSSYWDQFLRKNRSPVFLDRLQELNYQMQVYSPSPQTFPEFRKTLFVNMLEHVKDEYGIAPAHIKNAEALEDLTNFSISEKKPFFVYSLLDSTHAPYSFPDDHVKFEPIVDQVSYMSLSDEEIKLEIKNCYHNSLYYIDVLIGRLLETLEKQNVLKNTIIVITGDHGEEFLENGHIGHANAFTPYQVQVPMLVYIPGKKPQEYTHITSHHDLIPTLMPFLGVNSPSKDYSHGQSLFDDSPRDIIACSWSDCAYLDAEGFVVFGIKSHSSYKVEFRDLKYDVIAKAKGFTDSRKSKLPKILYRMGEYLK
ncbi:MAG: sulfatase-like hydrolase/transferase [Bdellovibrionaceae bacterium]|nr:sulfatase-like hydrolase/transferase [Pseudobdellovibrionaceae bacterium]